MAAADGHDAPPTRPTCGRCGAHLAADNRDQLCSPCSPHERGRRPPSVPGDFWDHPDMRAALATRHMGRIIRAYREHPHHGRRGPSQDDVAAWSGYTQGWISQTETGPPVNQLDRLVFWAQLLDVPQHHLWFSLPSRDSADDETHVEDGAEVALVVDRPDGGLLSRWIESVVRSDKASPYPAIDGSVSAEDDGGWLAALVHRSGRVGVDDVTRLVQRTSQLRRLDDFLGGFATMQLYATEARLTQRLLGGASQSSATRRALLGVYAEQVQQAGWASFDAGYNDRAERLFGESREAAEEAGDQALTGNSLAFLAYQRAFLGRPDVPLAEAAYEHARPTAPGRVQALLLERLAFTHAVAGNVYECERCLDLARLNLTSTGERKSPDWVFWVDSVEVDIMAGRCWSQLRRPLRAIPLLSSALALFDDGRARDKALYLTWLASSYVDASEPEQAAAVTERAVQLATGVASERPWTQIVQLGDRLAPYRSARTVAAVLKRIETEASVGDLRLATRND